MEHNKIIDLLNSDIGVVKGIGEKKKKLLNKLGVYSIWDMIYYFPRTYDNRTMFYNIASLPQEGNFCINARIGGSVIEKKIKNKMSLYIMRVEDPTGVLTVKWFSSPFNKHMLKRGQMYSLYGSLQADSKQREMILKDIEPFGNNELCGRIVPVYTATSGISQKELRKTIKVCLDYFEELPETLPSTIIKKYNLMNVYDALKHMHFPDDNEALTNARYRFKFEELFILSLSMKKVRRLSNKTTNVQIGNVKCVGDFANTLPFELTVDQKKVINEICADFKKQIPMNRLIQGDVGCGKTAVAACAAYAVVNSGYQVAIMAPTEILANQHFETFSEFFVHTDVKIGLLTSSTPDKKTIRNKIKNGEYNIVIGTHAIIQKNTDFFNLGLCITDEQHRFGVKQRAMLSTNDNFPHVLAMSATPIPRTLSLVVYGDLDISVITSIPSGRQKVDTFFVNQSMRSRLNDFIKKQVESGFQCFVVCPLIESDEESELNSGSDMFKYLSDIFSEFGVGFIHGKMSASEKDSIMNDFKSKKIHILVSTTVIEVGIDIPNATLIVIENAERFGLSTLHQLRGRVGRGNNKSYCVLVSDAKTDEAKERMKIMCSTSDGFKVASRDLEMRGCGEFFGTKQHGIPELKVANLFTDMPVVKDAVEACEEILSADPELDKVDYANLKLRIEKLLNNFENMNIFN